MKINDEGRKEIVLPDTQSLYAFRRVGTNPFLVQLDIGHVYLCGQRIGRADVVGVRQKGLDRCENRAHRAGQILGWNIALTNDTVGGVSGYVSSNLSRSENAAPSQGVSKGPNIVTSKGTYFPRSQDLHCNPVEDTKG